jgi:hypothetical protein
MHRTRSALAFAALTFAALAPAGAQLVGQLGVLDPSANGGINPATGEAWAEGDQYRLVFITSQTTNATSPDIATYNTFVQGVANSSTTFPDLGNATWKIVASTLAVDARDNTGTNPGVETGVPVFLMDGTTVFANDNTDLWNGANVAVQFDENGDILSEDRAFTGSNNNGTALGTTGDTALGVDSTPPDVSGVGTGRSDNTGWMRNFKAGWTAQNSVFAMSEKLTIVDPNDTTPPTLASSDIVDDKSPATVEVSETVTYTVTFSEAMDASTVETADFENNSTATATISVDGVSTTGDPAVFEVVVTPTGTGTLNLQVKAGADLKDVAGNAMVTTSAIADDTTLTVIADGTAPTVVSFDDNVAGGPILTGASVAYTVTFSEAMNASTVEIADFENNPIDDATITVDSVAPTGDPAVFVVTVTATGAGTLNLQVASTASLLDPAGNALAAATATPDDTIINVNDPDITPPTVLSFDDNVGGGPVNLGDPVTYGVTFSEDMKASTVGIDDFEKCRASRHDHGLQREPHRRPRGLRCRRHPGRRGPAAACGCRGIGAILTDLAGNTLDAGSASPDDDHHHGQHRHHPPTLSSRSGTMSGAARS